MWASTLEWIEKLKRKVQNSNEIKGERTIGRNRENIKIVQFKENGLC